MAKFILSSENVTPKAEVLNEENVIKLNIDIATTNSGIEVSCASADVRSSHHIKEVVPKFDLMDISSWPDTLTMSLRYRIITQTPNKVNMSDPEFPRNDEGRHFSNDFFNRVLPNSETYVRQ